MSLWRLLILLLLVVTPGLARKIKRKESHYHLNVPPPPPGAPPPHGLQQQAVPSEHQVPPYAFESINHDEFAPPPASSSYHEQLAHYENAQYAIHGSQGGHGGHSGGGGGSSHSGGFLVDNGLRSIAKGSADQALSAVASQNAAGKQASYVAKSTLAQAAAQAAGTVVAVLKGKEVLLHRLEEQSVEVHKALESELTQLQQAKRAAKAGQYAAQQAINHVSVLTAALNNAQSASELAQKAAAEAAAELASQIDMVAQAKGKVEQIESHTYAARLDYEETREAAEKATQSAQEAQLNANDAALHANVELGEAVHIEERGDRDVAEPAQPTHSQRKH